MIDDRFDYMRLDEIRRIARRFVPSTREAGADSARTSSKEHLIDLIEAAHISFENASAFLDNPDFFGELEDEDEPATATPAHNAQDMSADEQLAMLRNVLGGSASVNSEQVESIVNGKLETLKNELREELRPAVKTLEVKRIDGSVQVIGKAHKAVPEIASALNLGIHVMLVGPAGSGKTTAAHQCAEILNLKSYSMSVGPQTSKTDLMGFVDAGGNYHTTPIRCAFEFGGVLLLDEMDSANAGVLTILNSLLANGSCSFPDKIVNMHPDFRCICACNTYGRGADRMYVGRNQLDAATLDRFAVIEFNYDEDLEIELAGNREWAEHVQAVRHKAESLKERVVISPRASIFGAKLLAAGFEQDKVEEMVLWKGISPEIKRKLEWA